MWKARIACAIAVLISACGCSESPEVATSPAFQPDNRKSLELEQAQRKQKAETQRLKNDNDMKKLELRARRLAEWAVSLSAHIAV